MRAARVALVCLLVLTLPACAHDPQPGDIVHVTRTGHCYHAAGCRALRYSDIEITRARAIARGYRPCLLCGGG